MNVVVCAVQLLPTRASVSRVEHASDFDASVEMFLVVGCHAQVTHVG
ncbi:MAG: hypothetical protein IIB16_10280 [Chloroflexi bacterium]|nr:hypothetical protein [Chloroflexota bacterium]